MATRMRVTEITTGWNVAIKEQRCLHAVNGRAPKHKMCSNGYDCATCPFDQMLEDMALTASYPQAGPRSAERAA